MNCPSCGAECPPEHKFCGHCAAVLRPVEEEPRESFEGERRQASVVFSDLSGYTALNERLDPEDVLSMVSRLKAEAVKVVEAHGGTVNQFVGDEILALFGIPTAHSDDARRAIHAVQALHAMAHDHSDGIASQHGVELSMHTGIATGLVLATQSDDRDGRFAVTGDTVNLAARLRALAADDEICVDEETQAQAAVEFGFVPLPITEVKGKADSVACYRLTGMAGTAIRRTPFVGRQAELETYVGLLDEVCGVGAGLRAGQALYVRGEAGIGKTRLMEEFQRLATERGLACHTALIFDFGSGIGRDAIRSLARSLLAVGPDSDLETRSAVVGAAVAGGRFSEASVPFLNDLLDVPQTGEAKAIYDVMDLESRQEGLRETLAAIVEGALDRQPVLMVIEDLHWADPETLRRLAALTADIAELPALLVLSSRIEGDPLDAAWRGFAGTTPLHMMDLDPLDREDALELAQEYIDTTSRAALACIERAAGNPLFLEQLLYHAEEMDADGLPGSVQSIVLARLDSLPPTDKNALQAASVFGQRFSLEALRALIDNSEYECDEPIRHFLVRPQGDELLFSHALIQEGVYASLLRSRARQLHMGAAAWFMDRDLLLRAQHLERASHPDAPRAYLKAAESQLDVYQSELALRSLESARQIATSRDDRCDALLLRGRILHDGGSVPQAKSCLEEALSLADDSSRRCRARILLASCLRLQDRQEDALPILETAEQEAHEAGLDEELSELHYLRGDLHYTMVQVEECVAAQEAALEFARKANSPRCEARALGGLGDSHWVRRRMVTATQYNGRCCELAREHGFGRILVAHSGPYSAGLAWSDHRHIQEALDVGAEAVEFARRLNASRPLIILLVGQIGTRLRLLEEMGGVEGLIDEISEVAERAGYGRFQAIGSFFRVLLRYRRGEHEGLQELAETALEFFRATTKNAEADSLAVAALVTQDTDKRISYLREGEELLAAGAPANTHLFFFLHALDIALRDGEWTEAERLAGLLEGYLVEPWPLCEHLVERARLLAVYGRGRRDPTLIARIEEMREECRSLGLFAPCFDWVLGAESEEVSS